MIKEKSIDDDQEGSWGFEKLKGGIKFFEKFAKMQWEMFHFDEPTKRFIKHNKKKWKKNFRLKENEVILVGLFGYYPSLYCYSYITNYCSMKDQLKIEFFSFREQIEVRLEKLYESFGAQKGLTLEKSVPFEKKARELAEKIFLSLSSKRDVLDISIDNVTIGDLIYDTYLRSLVRPTIDIRDPELKNIINRALLIYYASKDYLLKKKVIAIIPDHTAYIDCGILVRLAFLKKIPVIDVHFRPVFMVIKIDPNLSEGMVNNAKRWPYYKFREIFKQLSYEEKKKACAKATSSLEERLSGKIDQAILQERISGKLDDAILKGHSAYTLEDNAPKIIKNNNKPNILIMLHDFCDSVHIYRNMLFPDFYDWIYFLLERAVQTDFLWHVKPHPNSLISEQKNIMNRSVVEELKKKFPTINFLEASVSNRQIISEGIKAMFTVHGTACHEFAYLGVPVVTAGDNLHIDYNFNIHPGSIKEFESYIFSADSLKIKIDQNEILEFFYMYYFYFREKNDSKTNPIPSHLLRKNDRDSQILAQYMQNESRKRDEEIMSYLDTIFSSIVMNN